MAATGDILTKVTLSDDGNTTTETYTNGLIASRVTSDTGGANDPWSAITYHIRCHRRIRECLPPIR